jgi:MFS superfamily sulfate permease-like transporter
LATIFVGLVGGEAAGVHLVGDLPFGLPHIALPEFNLTVLRDLAPGALAVVLAGYAEALGAAKAAAMQGGTRSSSRMGPPTNTRQITSYLHIRLAGLPKASTRA